MKLKSILNSISIQLNSTIIFNIQFNSIQIKLKTNERQIDEKYIQIFIMNMMLILKF